MSAPACTICHGTGEASGDGNLDCTACSAASDRAALNAYVKSLGPVAKEDLLWLVHQRAVSQVQQAAPKQALTDAQIKTTITAAVRAGKVSWLGYEKDDDGFYTIPVLSPYHYQFARAIEAASAPNAQLVEALKEMVLAYESHVPDHCNADWFDDYNRAIAALSAAGVTP
jgi:hypothetical protein